MQAPEVFRHYRNRYFNRSAHALEPMRNGGISFLLRPIETGVYNFWVYICPQDTGFSAKQAVRSLRLVANRGTKPWGQLKLRDDESLLDQLVSHLIKEEQALPSELGKQALEIFLWNLQEQTKLAVAATTATEATTIYQETA